MKKPLMTAVFLVLFSGIAQAVSPFDGIYSCRMTRSDGAYFDAYIPVNGTPSILILTTPNLTPATSYYGYTVGTITGNTYSGITSHGYTASGTVSGVAGSYALQGNTTAVGGGVAFPVTVSCSQVL